MIAVINHHLCHSPSSSSSLPSPSSLPTSLEAASTTRKFTDEHMSAALIEKINQMDITTTSSTTGTPNGGPLCDHVSHQWNDDDIKLAHEYTRQWACGPQVFNWNHVRHSSPFLSTDLRQIILTLLTCHFKPKLSSSKCPHGGYNVFQKLPQSLLFHIMGMLIPLITLSMEPLQLIQHPSNLYGLSYLREHELVQRQMEYKRFKAIKQQHH
jgi:hypothetical protein